VNAAYVQRGVDDFSEIVEYSTTRDVGRGEEILVLYDPARSPLSQPMLPEIVDSTTHVSSKQTGKEYSSNVKGDGPLAGVSPNKGLVPTTGPTSQPMLPPDKSKHVLNVDIRNIHKNIYIFGMLYMT
jgi:hypothetical protein